MLPYQIGIGEYGSDGPLLAGRSRPHYTYSRKSNFNTYKGSQSGFDLSDNEDEDNNLQPVSLCRWCELRRPDMVEFNNDLFALLVFLFIEELEHRARQRAQTLFWHEYEKLPVYAGLKAGL